MKKNNETIAAVSTAPGTGAIAIVRLSGDNAFEVLEKIFSGKKSVCDMQSRRVYLGYLVCPTTPSPDIVDEVEVVLFRSPHSYTGEHMVEIMCHGGVLITQRILHLLLEHGTRIAEPGEFTKRAFINGKMDLAQAEAVADVIQSRTEWARKSSIAQLTGALSREVDGIKNAIIELRSFCEVTLDFSEESISVLEPGNAMSLLEAVIDDVNELIGHYRHGHLIREGIKLVIIGRPNVGKSSLLNALLKKDRAIVTDIPGTTRDTLEEALDIQGILFRITDTAGLRTVADLIEREGMKRTKKHMSDADIIIAVLDVSEPLTEDDTKIFNYLKKVATTDEAEKKGPALILALNKIDLPKKWTLKHLPAGLVYRNSVSVSAKHNTGLKRLEKVLYEATLNKHEITQADLLLTNVRHWHALQETEQYLKMARDSLAAGYSEEFIALDLRNASDSLGKISGAVSSDEVLHTIFSRFCIGK